LKRYKRQRFKQKNERLFKLALKQIRISGISTPIVEVVAATGIAFTVAYGGYVVFKGESTPGNFFSFIAAVAMMYDPFKKLSEVNNVIQQGLAAANRIFSVLDEKPDIQDAPGAAALETFQDGIELENVWFSYQGHEGRLPFGGQPGNPERGGYGDRRRVRSRQVQPNKPSSQVLGPYQGPDSS